VKVDLADASDLLRGWSREGGLDRAIQLDRVQASILRQMREILSRMLQSEGYHEAVTMLQEILRLQRALRDQTREQVQASGADVFEDEPGGER